MSALRHDRDIPRAVDAARLDQHVLGLAPIGAAVHAQRAADRARNAAQEREARDAGFLRDAARPSRPAPPRRRARAARSRSRCRRSRGRAGSPRPATPPSRTIRFEPRPITVTGIVGREMRRGNRRDRLSSSGMNRTCAGPPTRNQVSSASDWFGEQPAAQRSRACVGNSCTRHPPPLAEGGVVVRGERPLPPPRRRGACDLRRANASPPIPPGSA